MLNLDRVLKVDKYKERIYLFKKFLILQVKNKGI